MLRYPHWRFVLAQLRRPRTFAQLVIWRVMGWPRQPWREIQFVTDALRRQTVRVCEWGIGASTVWYTHWLAQHGIDYQWYGVEHDPRWVAEVRARTDPARVHLITAPFQWTGTERTYVPTPDLEHYIAAPLTIGGSFDALLIDGRYRRRCVETARQVVAPGGLILLSDAHRLYYHCALTDGLFLDVGHTPGLRQRSSLAWIAHG